MMIQRIEPTNRLMLKMQRFRRAVTSSLVVRVMLKEQIKSRSSSTHWLVRPLVARVKSQRSGLRMTIIAMVARNLKRRARRTLSWVNAREEAPMTMFKISSSIPSKKFQQTILVLSPSKTMVTSPWIVMILQLRAS